MIDTIFALSSGAPPAAIAVVRVSGPTACESLERLCGRMPEPRRLVLRTLRDPETGTVLDHALVTWFAAEASVTGELLAELHLHGGRATVAAVEAALARTPGLRPAKAGEFTWRAFRNGKLDLIEVQSLSDLLRSETEAQRRAALSGSHLSRDVETWRRDVLLLSAMAEARLDQSDEDDVPADSVRIQQMCGTLLDAIGRRLQTPPAERLFDGLRVVFAGPPNAGKSSLINVIADREVAITSAIAGTTRDVIEAPVRIDGIALVLTDTAGLRAQTSDPLEEEGIRRAEQRLGQADIIIWMGPGDPPSTSAAVIAISAKADLGELMPDRLRVSAKSGEGVQALVERLVQTARTLLPQEGEAVLSRRQREHLSACHDALKRFAVEEDELLAAEHLRAGRRSLDELTGRAGTEDMLDALFGTFCIGK